MMHLKTLLLFALLTLKAANAGGIYDIAVLYDLAILDDYENGTVKEYSECTAGESQKLRQISDRAMEKIELISQQQSQDHWLSYMDWDDDHYFEIDDETGSSANLEERRLCNSFCSFMCKLQGTYCKCCSCCGTGRRRRLGSSLRIFDDSPENLDKLETAAEDAVYEELANSPPGFNITCLFQPYRVIVKLMANNGTSTWEERSAERLAVRLQHIGDRRDSRDQVAKARKKFLSSQRNMEKALRKMDEAAQEVQQKEEKMMEATEAEILGMAEQEEEWAAQEAEAIAQGQGQGQGQDQSPGQPEPEPQAGPEPEPQAEPEPSSEEEEEETSHWEANARWQSRHNWWQSQQQQTHSWRQGSSSSWWWH